MTNKTTNTATELPLLQRHLSSSSAVTAGLACIPWVDLYQCGTACDSLVFQHPDEIAPRSIVNMFSETMIMNHAVDIQILHSDEPISLRHPSGGLMKEIKPLIGNPKMLSSETTSRFQTVSAALDFSTHPALQKSQAFLRFDEITGVLKPLTIGTGCKGLNANIHPNPLTRSVFNVFHSDFAGEDSEPLAGLVSLDGKSLNLALGDAMQHDREIPYLGDMQSSLRNELEAGLRVGDAVNTGFEPREPFLSARGVFHSSEEILERFSDTVRDVLFHLGEHLGVFAGKLFVVIELAKSFPCFFVCSDGALKKIIVDFLAGIKSLKKSLSLFLRWVQTILIHPHFHMDLTCLRNYLSLRIHPTSEEVGFLLRRS
jgi:hypothetical protein